MQTITVYGCVTDRKIHAIKALRTIARTNSTEWADCSLPLVESKRIVERLQSGEWQELHISVSDEFADLSRIALQGAGFITLRPPNSALHLSDFTVYKDREND